VEKENPWTFVSIFTEFSMVLTHPTFLEAAEFPRSDGCLFVYAKPVGNLQNTFPQNVFAVCSTGTANILEY